MANLALSTQIPQIGDSSQQLLARMSAALSDQNQNLSSNTWLSSGSRTTTQSLDNISVPQGVKSVLLRVNVTAVPGVDTLQVVIRDSVSFLWLAFTPASAVAGQFFLLLRTPNHWIGSPGAISLGSNGGLTERVSFVINHSGAGAFTYSATYQFLKT